MIRKALAVILGNLFVLLCLLLLLEGAAQVFAMARPSYDVLFLQPDPVVGWKQVPNLQWTWAGHEWYAADFSVPIHTNALGFRDLDRSVDAAAGVDRVAMLGDSFIEAVQVPLEQTAAQVLEHQLNQQSPSGATKWEVLNFGISNYGVGQYLLAWREYARKFHPRYVTAFVSRLHMRRTITKYEYGAFAATESRSLWIRPTFRLENDALVAEPAQDYQEFARTQEALVRGPFGGDRMRRKKRIVTLYYAQQLYDAIERRRAAGKPVTPSQSPGLATQEYTDAQLFPVNLRLLSTLGSEVAASGGRFAVIDVADYLDDDPATSAALKALCARENFGYINASEPLIAARKRGVRTHWAHDFHFSPAGNRILAEAVDQWLLTEIKRP